MNKRQIWYKYEKIAEDFLIEQNYKIIEKNFTIRWWELDIIAEKDWIIYFVEVKWVSGQTDFQDYISKKKQQTLKKTAEHRIWKRPWQKAIAYSFLLVLVKWDSVIDFVEFTD